MSASRRFKTAKRGTLSPYNAPKSSIIKDADTEKWTPKPGQLQKESKLRLSKGVEMKRKYRNHSAGTHPWVICPPMSSRGYTLQELLN
jgi:hypothetical protein